MSEVNSKQLKSDLAKAAALLQQSEILEQTARNSFTDLLARLKKNSELLSKIVEPKMFESFVFKGIFIKLPPESGYDHHLRLTEDAELFITNKRVQPIELIEKVGAVKCIEALISAIRKRIDAITTQHESARSAIAMANAMLPD